MLCNGVIILQYYSNALLQCNNSIIILHITVAFMPLLTLQRADIYLCDGQTEGIFSDQMCLFSVHLHFSQTILVCVERGVKNC